MPSQTHDHMRPRCSTSTYSGSQLATLLMRTCSISGATFDVIPNIGPKRAPPRRRSRAARDRAPTAGAARNRTIRIRAMMPAARIQSYAQCADETSQTDVVLQGVCGCVSLDAPSASLVVIAAAALALALVAFAAFTWRRRGGADAGWQVLLGAGAFVAWVLALSSGSVNRKALQLFYDMTSMATYVDIDPDASGVNLMDAGYALGVFRGFCAGQARPRPV